jgi:hypothetical protein
MNRAAVVAEEVNFGLGHGGDYKREASSDWLRRV